MGKSKRNKFDDFDDEMVHHKKQRNQKKNKKYKNALRSKDIEYLTKLDDEEI